VWRAILTCVLVSPTFGCGVSDYLLGNSWFVETGMVSVSTSDLGSGTGVSSRLGVAEDWHTSHRLDWFLQYDRVDLDTAIVSSAGFGLIGYFGDERAQWFVGGWWPYRWSSTGDSELGISFDLGGALVAERFQVKLSGVFAVWPGDGTTSAGLRLGLSVVLF
jgi:hypothetical protein